jgi:hypothetical protein
MYMKYPRQQYHDPAVKVQNVKTPWGTDTVDAPVFDAEITAKENFRRCLGRRNPIWFPNSLTDKITINPNDTILAPVRGMQIHADFNRKATENYKFKDWFNTDWTWVCVAGGATLTPGTQLLDDITKWEKVVKFPDLSEWGFKEKAGQYMKTLHDPNKAVSYDMGRGVTERLVAIMGGYMASMEALLVEPEAVLDFFNAYMDFMIDFFDVINALYPLDFITIHDDWGTERDTFFSEKVMEELVFEPTKRLTDHIKSKDVFIEWHTCGNVTRFFPHMVELGLDIAQVQRRAVNMPLMKEKFGDRIGFCAMLEGVDPANPPSHDEYIEAVRKTVDIYAPGGGSYLMMFTPDPKLTWDSCVENYCRSREIFDKERAG